MRARGEPFSPLQQSWLHRRRSPGQPPPPRLPRQARPRSALFGHLERVTHCSKTNGVPRSPAAAQHDLFSLRFHFVQVIVQLGRSCEGVKFFLFSLLAFAESRHGDVLYNTLHQQSFSPRTVRLSNYFTRLETQHSKNGLLQYGAVGRTVKECVC